MPLRVLAAYGLGALLVSVPVKALAGTVPADGSTIGPLAAIVAGPDHGFVLERDGHILRATRDGSLRVTAAVGPYRTPFGTAVGGRVVFGGIRCGGAGCRDRVAEFAVLDEAGGVDKTVTLRREGGWPTALDGLALVGTADETVWVAGGGRLYGVAVSPAAVAAEVPWPGGEPCVVDGKLYDLEASGGTYVQQGAELASAATFRLRLQAWDGTDWRPVDGGSTSMPHRQNAYCAPGGYEIRDGRDTLARWEPATGWRRFAPAPVPASAASDAESTGFAPVTASTRSRYVVDAAGSLFDVTEAGRPRRTALAIPGFSASDAPVALQVDDAGGWVFWCATTYRAGLGATRCGTEAAADECAARSNLPPGTHESRLRAVAPRGWRAGPGGRLSAQRFSAQVGCSSARRPRDRPASSAARGPLVVSRGRRPPTNVQHYNMCSAACGGGVRPHSRDVVVEFVGRQYPVAVSLNELCYDDLVYLAGRLPGLTAGAGYQALATATSCPGAVKQFGNQVFVRSSLTPGPGAGSAWAQFRSQATTPCDHHGHECRGMVCSEADSGRQRLVVCSAHLETPRRGPVAVAQAREYVALVRDRYGSQVATVLAGDFNLDRAAADTVLVPHGYQAPATGPTIAGDHSSGTSQIDMIYADGPGQAGRSGATYCDLQASDHCYLVTSWSPSRAR